MMEAAGSNPRFPPPQNDLLDAHPELLWGPVY